MSTTTTIKRHPIRGALWGVILGLGLALIAVGQSIAALGTWPPFLLVVLGVVLGVVWAYVAPAKKRAPVEQESVPVDQESVESASNEGGET